MKKPFLTLLTIVFCLAALPQTAQAQRGGADYQTSAGLRLSWWYGVSVKHFLQGNNAVEGILHSHGSSLKITGLYEVHSQAFDEPGLRFYYGGGGHVGFADDRYLRNRDRDYNYYSRGTRGVIGVDGIIGLEYTIQDSNVPLNVSVDWKPAIDFTPQVWFVGAEIGVTVRYIFR